MCLRNVYYPLVKFIDGNGEIKRKINFKMPFNMTGRVVAEEMEKAVKYFKDLYPNMNDGGFMFEKMVSVPCGSCRECLTQSSRSWAFRIMKEAKQHDDNWFITFTYDDDHIPSNGMLDVNAISDFNKKLKVYLKRKGYKSDFRFYGVGEYGGQTARPHYHVIYFGLDIPDLKYVCKTQKGDFVFDSEFIKNVWQNGFITIEGVDVGSACYVARYCDKKKRLNKSQKEDLRNKGIVPEFSRMSNRPGIGAAYMDKAEELFVEGIFNDYINGKSYSFPLYFTKKLKKMYADTPELFKYEDEAKKNQYAKIARNLELSDGVGDLSDYYDKQDKVNSKKRGL